MIGVDIVKINRIERAIQNEQFLHRVFTEKEREYAFSRNNPTETLAGIYAAKEAVSKLLRTGLNFSLLKAEVCYENGAPYMLFDDQKIYLSISHDGEYALHKGSDSARHHARACFPDLLTSGSPWPAEAGANAREARRPCPPPLP